MATLKNLTVPRDNNFIRLCNDLSTNVVICNIIPPANAIDGYQLNVILGPNLTSTTSVNNFINGRKGIAFNWNASMRYLSSDTTPNKEHGNIIYPEFVMSGRSSDVSEHRFADLGMANVSWDPNESLGSESPSFYPADVQFDYLLQCPKLLQFVYVTNYYPLRRDNKNDPVFSCQEVGNFWILQNIQVMSIEKLAP